MDIQAKAAHTVSLVMSLNMLMWLTMLTFFASVLSLAAAIYLAIAAVLGPALAALFAGLALLGVFIVLAVVIRMALRPAPKSTEKEREPRIDNAVEHNLRPIIGNRATDWTRDHTGAAIVGALAAGVILTASPKLRHFMVRAAGPILTRKAISAVQDFSGR